MQPPISDIRLYEMLKSKIGQPESEAFIQIWESKVNEKINSKTSVFTTKEDIARVEIRISESKVDVIKWMVTTSIGVVGILIAVIKFIH